MKLVLLVLAIVFALKASTDVQLMASPEPMNSSILPLKAVGVWDVSIVNYSDQPVTISAPMILMAMPDLHHIDPRRAQALIQHISQTSWRSRGLRYLGYVMVPMTAIAGGGLISLSAQGVAALAIGATVLHQVGDNIQAQQPDLSVFQDTLSDEITLAPFGQHGFSMSFTIFASKMKGAHTIGPVSLKFPPVANNPPLLLPGAAIRGTNFEFPLHENFWR